MRTRIAFVAIFIFAVSCKGREPSALSANALAFSNQDLAQLKSFLKTYCTECHSTESGKGGFDYVEDLSRLRSSSLVVPGQPEKSQLWQRVVGLKADPDSRMPPAYAANAVQKDDDRDIIGKWIAAGAPSGVVSGAREIVSNGKMLQIILNDLNRLSPDQRRDTRYLSLINLYDTVVGGEYAVSDQRLATYRSGISKLVNSLSWNPKPTPVEIVSNSNGTLLRLDLRAYSSDARKIGLTHLEVGRIVGLSAEAWEKIVQVDPYRIEYQGEIAQDIRQFTGTKFPIMRADFFTFKAGVGSNYYEILGIEKNLGGLEKSIFSGQSSADRVRQRKPVVRSGFTNSGVSKHNRLIERHDIDLYRNAAYWVSYDFSASVGRKQLTANPLGPRAAFDNDERVFLHDGGEVIFNLPNGLQAYMLTDNKGNLLNEAPVNIVQDPKRTVITNAVSCMDCHRGGLLKKADQIRGVVEANQDIFNALQLDFVRYAYPRSNYKNNLFDTSVDRDTVRYRNGVEQSKLARDDQAAEDIEPVSDLYDYFNDTGVTAEMAAAEVGMTSSEFLTALQAKPNLRIVLGNFLIQGGGSVKRETFKDLFPQIVRELELDKVRLDTSIAQVSGAGGRVGCKVEITKAKSTYSKIIENTSVSRESCEKEALARCEEIIRPIKAQGYECRVK